MLVWHNCREMSYFLGSSHTHWFNLTIKFVVSLSTFEFNINISKKHKGNTLLLLQRSNFGAVSDFWVVIPRQVSYHQIPLPCSLRCGFPPSLIPATSLAIHGKHQLYKNIDKSGQGNVKEGNFLCNNTRLIVEQILSFMRVMLIQPCWALNRWHLLFNYLYIHLSQQLEECSTQCLRPSQVLRLDFHERYCSVEKIKNKHNKISACLLHHGLRVTFRKQYSSICQLVIRHYRGFNQITGPPICWFLTRLCFLSCITNKAQTETPTEIIMIILL